MSRLSYNKSVLKNLAKVQDKTELKQEKIQLGLLQDGEQSAEQLLDISKELVGLAGSVNRIKVSVKALANDGVEQERFLQKVSAEIIAINKELGITSKVPQLDKIEQAIDKFQDTFNLIDSIGKIKV